MPTITLHTHSQAPPSYTPNPLPELLQTPSGLAILEIQGTIHAPFPSLSESALEDASSQTATATDIGRLEFPLYDASVGEAETKWMKKVYLYVGRHQRLTGEVKRLPKAIAVLRRREHVHDEERGKGEEGGEELEIAEIVRWKILFAGRPEPVSAEQG